MLRKECKHVYWRFFRDASAFQINKGTEKCVKYDIESFLSAFLQQLPVWIAL